MNPDEVSEDITVSCANCDYTMGWSENDKRVPVCYDCLYKMNTDLQSRLSRAERVIEYATHTSMCRYWMIDKSLRDCNCGYVKVRTNYKQALADHKEKK